MMGGGAMEPLPTVTSCWSDQQMAFAYVQNIHRSRLSYSPRQHLRLPGAAGRAGLAAKPLGAAGSAAGHKGDPDTCAGAGASRTGWCWALRAPSLVRRGSRVGLRDTPVPGQSRHWCLGGPHAAPAAGQRPRLTLLMAGPLRGSRHRSSTPRLLRKHLESAREKRAWSQAGATGNTPNHPRSGLLLSRPCCAPAPDPTQPPPTLCLLQTIVLHLHKLSPRSPETTVSRRGGAVRTHGGEGQRGCGAVGGSPGCCWRWGQERPARGAWRGPLSSPSAPQGGTEQAAGTGHGRVQPSLCRSSSTVGPRSFSAQPPSCPARGCSGSAGAGGGAGPARAGGGGSAELWCSVRGSLYIFIYKQGQQCCGVAMRNSCSGAGCSRKIWCCSSNGEIRGTAKARRRFCAPAAIRPSLLPSGSAVQRGGGALSVQTNLSRAVFQE